MRGCCNSRRQLVDCLAHRGVEIIQPLPTQSPIEGPTNISAGQPKFDIIRPVDQGVLVALHSTIDQHETRRKLTLIIVRIMLTEPKTALAGVILASSFAKFKASMAAFNAEIAPSRPFGRWDSAFMVETRGSGERIVQGEGREEGLEP